MNSLVGKYDYLKEFAMHLQQGCTSGGAVTAMIGAPVFVWLLRRRSETYMKE